MKNANKTFSSSGSRHALFAIHLKMNSLRVHKQIWGAEGSRALFTTRRSPRRVLHQVYFNLFLNNWTRYSSSGKSNFVSDKRLLVVSRIISLRCRFYFLRGRSSRTFAYFRPAALSGSVWKLWKWIIMHVVDMPVPAYYTYPGALVESLGACGRGSKVNIIFYEPASTSNTISRTIYKFMRLSTTSCSPPQPM